MTHSPTSGDSYQEMDNPDRKDKEHPKSYIRRYLRKDRMWAKGKKLGFSLSPRQESIVDSMLAQREENKKAMKKPTPEMEPAIAAAKLRIPRREALGLLAITRSRQPKD